jgi:hypothetical protein
LPQDAKALQVRWNGGRPLFSPTKITLSGSFWKGSLAWFVGSFLFLHWLLVLWPNREFALEAADTVWGFTVWNPVSWTFGCFLYLCGVVISGLCSLPWIGPSVFTPIVNLCQGLQDGLLDTLGHSWHWFQSTPFYKPMMSLLDCVVSLPDTFFTGFCKLVPQSLRDWLLSFSATYAGWLFHWTVGVDDKVDVSANSFAFSGAVAVWLLQGFIAGLVSYESPQKWLADALRWVCVLLVSTAVVVYDAPARHWQHAV